MTYVLKSVKAIEFYDKNPSLDFNNVNEMFIELIQKITNTIQESISVNEIKALLNRINKNVEGLEQNANSNSKLIQMTYDHLGNQQEYYVQQMKHLLQNRDKDSDILSLIRETNHTLIERPGKCGRIAGSVQAHCRTRKGKHGRTNAGENDPNPIPNDDDKHDANPSKYV